ncbi:MAG: hypothetical protein L7U70_04615 [Flavobacteriales bacterium]|nr:hypothetical protein [Flavobacteriales bacterium]
MNKERIYQIALTLVPKVGDVIAKKLIAYCGSAEAVFKEPKKNLMRIPGIGSVLANTIVSKDLLSAAEFELRFMEQNGVQPLYYKDDDYPFRLKQCVGSPIVMYQKGHQHRRNTKSYGLRSSDDRGNR